jgi:hypothetical protein
VSAPVEWHVGNYQGRRVGGSTKVAYGMVVKVFDRTQADMNSNQDLIYFQDEKIERRAAE